MLIHRSSRQIDCSRRVAQWLRAHHNPSRRCANDRKNIVRKDAANTKGPGNMAFDMAALIVAGVEKIFEIYEDNQKYVCN